MKLFTADRDGTMGARVNGTVSFGYADIGGVGPSTAMTRGSMGVWIDVYPNGPYGVAFKEEVLWHMNGLGVLPLFPWFDSRTVTGATPSIGLSWQAQAGVTYAVWSGAAQSVGTWGPAGAQSNLELYITEVLCHML
jgi:hypothetical protein